MQDDDSVHKHVYSALVAEVIEDLQQRKLWPEIGSDSDHDTDEDEAAAAAAAPAAKDGAQGSDGAVSGSLGHDSSSEVEDEQDSASAAKAHASPTSDAQHIADTLFATAVRQGVVERAAQVHTMLGERAADALLDDVVEDLAQQHQSGLSAALPSADFGASHAASDAGDIAALECASAAAPAQAAMHASAAEDALAAADAPAAADAAADAATDAEAAGVHFIASVCNCFQQVDMHAFLLCLQYAFLCSAKSCSHCGDCAEYTESDVEEDEDLLPHKPSAYLCAQWNSLVHTDGKCLPFTVEEHTTTGRVPQTRMHVVLNAREGADADTQRLSVDVCLKSQWEHAQQRASQTARTVVSSVMNGLDKWLPNDGGKEWAILSPALHKHLNKHYRHDEIMAVLGALADKLIDRYGSDREGVWDGQTVTVPAKVDGNKLRKQLSALHQHMLRNVSKTAQDVCADLAEGCVIAQHICSVCVGQRQFVAAILSTWTCACH